MKLPMDTTKCLIPGLCPEIISSLIRGLALTSLFVGAIVIMIGAALLVTGFN